MITRDELTRVIDNNLSYLELDRMLDLIESNDDREQFILHYYNETVLIYDTSTDYYISWYKITHIGRSLHTNITDIAILDMFIMDLKDILI